VGRIYTPAVSAEVVELYGLGFSGFGVLTDPGNAAHEELIYEPVSLDDLPVT
jgi:hypothetical protein